MKIKYSDQFKNEASSKLGIRRSYIEPAIKNPDKKFEIKLKNGIKPIYFIKKIINVSKPYFLLIDCFVENGESIVVNMAWKIFPELHEDVEYLTPIQLIHAFVHKFGLKITIGNESDYIFFDKTIIADKGKDLRIVSINNPDNHKCIQSMLFKYTEENGKLKVQCRMVFCIDFDKYLNWIKSV